MTWSRVVNQIKRNRQQIAWCHYNELEPGEVDGQIGLLIDVSILVASCSLVTGRQYNADLQVMHGCAVLLDCGIVIHLSANPQLVLLNFDA